MKEYLKLLGYLVNDVVTNQKGIVTSISFDLAGCVQSLIMPACSSEGTLPDPHWFDTKRLVLLSKEPVMPLPVFEIIPGGQSLPNIYESKPAL